MDAPELAQTCTGATQADWPCGKAAAAEMMSLAGGADVTCIRSGTDFYGRVLAHCAAAHVDLGLAMVRAGLAIALDEYGPAQDEARAAKRGIWAGSFTVPAVWRREHVSDAAEKADGWFWGWFR